MAGLLERRRSRLPRDARVTRPRTGRAAETAARSALASADHEAFPRNHTIYTVRLASVLTHLGQLDEAIDVTSRAVQDAELLRGSRRISADLQRTVDRLGQQSYAPAKTFAAAAQRLLAT